MRDAVYTSRQPEGTNAHSLDRTTGVSANLHQILELILYEGLIDLAPRISFGGNSRWKATKRSGLSCAKDGYRLRPFSPRKIKPTTTRPTPIKTSHL